MAKEIITKEDFETFLNSNYAVLFLDQGWSAYTVVMSQYIYEWYAKSPLIDSGAIKSYFLVDTSQNFFKVWVTDLQKKNRSIRQIYDWGYGDMVWIRNGEIIHGTSVFVDIGGRPTPFQNKLEKMISRIRFRFQNHNENRLRIRKKVFDILEGKTAELIKQNWA